MRETGKSLSSSGLVAKILEEYFKVARVVDTEVEDLKRELADKEAALSKLRDQDSAIIGLQNELDTARTQVKTLEDKLAIYIGLHNDLKADNVSTYVAVRTRLMQTNAYPLTFLRQLLFLESGTLLV